ncbi:MAG: fasciclin domain-containing protein [Bacteroidia bacterium]|nr:fasciclin domain-containing protein [Bacteroidia bacterium]
MKTTLKYLLVAGSIGLFSCGSQTEAKTENNSENNTEATATEATGAGQSGVQDATSNPNIVQVAIGSKDHTTLVAAVKAGELVDALSNAGPFTVFAPTNAAFDKLPAGTVDGLLKPEKKEDLQNILGYHTYVGALKVEYMNDNQEYDMVYGGKVKITKQGDKTFVNGSEIIASITTANGIIHVIGDVLLPK